MPDELSGFAPEPEYPLAAHAEAELLRERLYAAQNLLVKREAEIARLENERDGKVLVDPEDLQVALRMTCDCPEAMPVTADEDAVLQRLTEALRAGDGAP